MNTQAVAAIVTTCAEVAIEVEVVREIGFRRIK